MKRYKIIYADPPWEYRSKTGNKMKSGASMKYKTMSFKELSKIPIDFVCDRDCVLFLWVTVPLMDVGFNLLKAWGFKYKTAVFWRKIMSLGMGWWFRGQVEVCLLGIRGSIRAFRIQKANFIQCKVGRHSTKPIEMYELIEMTGLDPKLELFARSKRDGWDSIGYGVDGLDIAESIRLL